ncbi:MAG: HEPN domain-containing protein [Thermodesulfobacteriota bacterium]|nr:HEPN domain-containing protein [Thermodesulfobacteriota bacterium]
MKKFTFDVEKTVSYWAESAQYDLGVASAMLKARKYPYALFMGHLALEKLLKALVVKKTRAHAPFSHSLPYLLERSGIKMPEPMQVRLSEFMEFHLEARYPDASRAFYRKCTKGYTDARFKEIKEVFKWIKTKL